MNMMLHCVALSTLSASLLASPVRDDPASEAAAASRAGSEVVLKTKVYRNWKFRLPAESWKSIAKAIVLPCMGADVQFRAQLDGTALALDTDADGEFDTKIDAEAAGVVLLVKGEQRVAVRLRAKPDWSYAPASVKRGKIEGRRLSVIDQNNNGRFDDFGQDAMVIGAGKTASFLSKVVRVKGKLYTIAIAADGGKLSYAPYEGATSELSLQIASKGKLLAAVLKSVDGSLSFDLSQAKSEILLPTSTYRLHSGLLSFGGNKVHIKTGRSKPISLKAGTQSKLRLGGPLAVEFAYQVRDGKYHFSPSEIWYYGRSGEEYYDWQPLGKSPKIAIDDGRLEKRIAELVFPPNC